jgi:hypothetical protein
MGARKQPPTLRFSLERACISRLYRLRYNVSLSLRLSLSSACISRLCRLRYNVSLSLSTSLSFFRVHIPIMSFNGIQTLQLIRIDLSSSLLPGHAARHHLSTPLCLLEPERSLHRRLAGMLLSKYPSKNKTKRCERTNLGRE